MAPRIMRSPLTGNWYVVTKYTQHETHITAHTKYDVTDQMMTILAQQQQVIDALVKAAEEAKEELQSLHGCDTTDGLGDPIDVTKQIVALESALRLAKEGEQSAPVDQQKGDKA